MPELEVPKYLFSNAPRNVYWETTIACSLACQHCRAQAIAQRDPEELSTEEGYRLIDSIKELGSLLVLTGGDPLERHDLLDLVRYARSIHVPVAVTPSTTPTLKRETVAAFRDLGITALGVSLDGPTPEIHDTFRGVAGTFGHSQAALAWAREFEVPVQINTTISQFTRPHLEHLFRVLSDNSPPVRRWSLFFLIATGRGQTLLALSADQIDELFSWAYDLADKAPFHISTVEAPHYRRYWLERKRAEGISDTELAHLGPRHGFGIRDGNGVIFVARNGDVYPAGFLPNPRVGNVRHMPLHQLYRTAPQLLSLRNMDALEGRCGRCQYRWLCGGSRARAWAASGNLLAEDPGCSYRPAREIEPIWPGYPVPITRSDAGHGHGHPTGIPT